MIKTFQQVFRLLTIVELATMDGWNIQYLVLWPLTCICDMLTNPDFKDYLDYALYQEYCVDDDDKDFKISCLEIGHGSMQ